MYSLINDFNEELKEGKYLAILPISRFVIEESFNLGKFKFYPAYEVNLEELRMAPNNSLTDFSTNTIMLKGQNLREIKSSVTEFNNEILQENTLVAFTINLDWNSFLLSDHEKDLKLIGKLSQEAEKAMDFIRFYFCRMDLPDTLPGQVGTWDGSNGFSGALLYTLFDNESYLIAGSVVTHLVVKGIGLELSSHQISSLKNTLFPADNTNETGKITQMGLSLFTGVLDAYTDTTKFIRSMNLLEFLAFPHDFKQFQEVKKQISYHVAKKREHYEQLLDRFFELTGKKDEITGKHIGYRTRIIHLGETLESILEDDKEIKKLFLELQGYIGSVIQDMLEHSDETWEEFLAYRHILKRNLDLIN